WVFSPPAFRLKGYSVMVGERPGLRAGGVWNQTCILCHNTAPYLLSMFGELSGPRAPSYQGEVVDRLLPAARRLHYEVTDAGGLARAIAAEMALLGDPSFERADGEPTALLTRAIRTTRAGLRARHLLEV